MATHEKHPDLLSMSSAALSAMPSRWAGESLQSAPRDSLCNAKR